MRWHRTVIAEKGAMKEPDDCLANCPERIPGLSAGRGTLWGLAVSLS